jgi:nitrogen fixation/metabolism regulation signal transduction histidine kinase
MGQDYKIGRPQSRINIVIVNLKTELTHDLRRITIVQMLFRSKIFVTIFTVGLLPAVILLVVSAYLINSTLQRVGASGLESSVEAAGTLVHWSMTPNRKPARSSKIACRRKSPGTGEMISMTAVTKKDWI